MTDRSPAACGAARPRLSAPEAAVIIVIVVLASLMTHRGTPPSTTAAALAGAGLLAAAVVRLGQGHRLRSAALRRAGKALLSSVET